MLKSMIFRIVINILCVYYCNIGNNSKFVYFIRLTVKETSLP